MFELFRRRHELLFGLLLNSGLRISEALSLKQIYTHVDQDRMAAGVNPR